MRIKFSRKAATKQTRFHLKPVYASVLLACAVQTLQANPLNPTVVNGQASFTNNGNTLTVTNTPGTIINWQDFSIDANEITRFNQQSAASTVLNRVVGSDPSSILGSLQSNGRVFLINPNGIMFGAGSTVDVAGLLASTLNLSDDDFLARRNRFTVVPGAGNVGNAGNITAKQGGQIFLIAPNVENIGIITAPNGEILLIAGHSVDLVNTNDPTLRVSITAPAGDVTNVGKLIAESGSLGLFGTVVKNSGTVSANSAALEGGKIVFRASQRVEAGGTISASGVGGGEINILADMQSGTVNISGTLDASAPVSGNGGFIDTSAAHVQVADSARVNTAAANGRFGNWLIDPTDYYVSASDPLNGSSYMSNTALSSNLELGNITIQTLASGTGNGDIFVNDAVSWSSPTTLTLNAIRNVEINAPITSSSFIGAPGNLTVRADLNGSGTGTIVFGTSGSVSLQGGSVSVIYGAANLYYNPVSYASPTIFSGVTTPYTAWMLVNDVGSSGGTLGLQAMNTNLSGNYALGKDINATVTSGWNAGAGFVPIGNGTTNFTGKFDGLGHTISNLTINSIGSDVGLFGVVGLSGIVRNVGLINSYMVGKDGVGGLVGNNNGFISNSYVKNGIVDVTGSTGLSVGGLAGINSGTISNSYVSGGSVRGTYYRVGGLVGYNNGSSASISNSYVSGVTVVNAATFGTDVGGLVGNNSGSISSSYVNGGSVAGHSKGQIGGLAGINSGSINTSYASNGSLIGGTNIQVGGAVGGLAGVNSGTITNSYWDSSTTGILAAAGVDIGILSNVLGLTTAETMSSASVSALGFDVSVEGSWWMSDGNTRPFLRSEYSTTITNSHQLQLMAIDNNTLSASYTLATDINMAETATGVGMWGSAGFVPVGNSTPFSGQFDGLGHTISNLNINRPSTSDTGLFGYAAGGLITNVGLLNPNVSGGSNVGALAGNISSSISNSYVSGGSVSGFYDSNVGGLVGSNSAIISNSYVTGGMVVTGSSSVGGLVGANSGSISDSYVTGGTVVTGSSSVGGLVGNNQGSVSNSHYNISSVSINGVANQVTQYGLFNDLLNINNVGQFDDWYNDAQMTPLDIANYSSTLPGSAGSYTISNVNGMKNLLGFADNAAYTFTLSNNINLTDNAGLYIPYLAADFNGNNHTISNLNINQPFNDNLGLFGQIAYGSSVSNVGLLNAVVVGGSNVGAIAGHNNGTISNSYANGGSVSGTYSVGGLVGYNSSLDTIINSYASGNTVLGITDVGGLVGYNTGSIDKSYASNSVSVGVEGVIGGVVGRNFSSGSVSGNFWDKTITSGAVNGIGYDDLTQGGSDLGAVGMSTTNMQTLANFTSATAANGNVNPAWDIASVGGTGTVWSINEGQTAPLLTSFLTPPTTLPPQAPPPITPQVTNELVNTTLMFSPNTGSSQSTIYEDEAKDVVLAVINTATDDNATAEPLPVCN